MEIEPFELAVLACEPTDSGWRGLTSIGEVLNVAGKDIPDSLTVMHEGQAVGYYEVPRPEHDGRIGRYLQEFDRASALMRLNQSEAALEAVDAAISIADTATARFNRGLILLQLGRWTEGFQDYSRCEEMPSFQRPLSRRAVSMCLPPWRGEDIRGARMALLHDHGFGDSIMSLRFLPQLRAMGADVVMVMPPELRRLAEQQGSVVATIEEADADCFCTMLGLMTQLRVTPENISTEPYLRAPETWARTRDKRIGLAWSVSKISKDDYPRSIPLSLLSSQLEIEAELYSVQKQGGPEADLLGVSCHRFEDFADCASLMMSLDEIVTVDTAALHLAGAIGHPRITALLSHWHSWRWRSPLYRNVTFCAQDAPGDWTSALAKRRSEEIAS